MAAPSVQERKAKIEAIKPAPDSQARKIRSENLLIREGVPISRTLPVIQSEQNTLLRSKEEIANRAQALLLVASKADGLDQASVERTLRSSGLEAFFSPAEKHFIHDPKPSEHDKNQFIWRFEAAWTLLWALGYVDHLEKPATICDLPKVMALLKSHPGSQLAAGAKLRSKSEMLDQADLIYRYHWAVVEARLKQQKSPAGLDPDVVIERHHTLNWLIGYMNQQWDEISTDT